MHRRTFLKGCFSLSLAGALGYRAGDAKRLELTLKRIPLAKASTRSVSILHLSDLHHSKPDDLAFIQQACCLGLSTNPDLILLTGDYINARLPSPDNYAQVLSELAHQAPTFACMGNHDGGAWAKRHGYKDTQLMRSFLEQSGIRCLHNANTRLTIRGIPLQLVGVADLWSGELDAPLAFPATPDPAAAATLLLCHNPDAKDELFQYHWDVMFAGHTHGGQFQLPFSGDAPLAPINDTAFVSGLIPWGSRFVHVNRGIASALGLRLNCRPEVSVLDLLV